MQKLTNTKKTVCLTERRSKYKIITTKCYLFFSFPYFLMDSNLTFSNSSPGFHCGILSVFAIRTPTKKLPVYLEPSPQSSNQDYIHRWVDDIFQLYILCVFFPPIPCPYLCNLYLDLYKGQEYLVWRS